MRQPSPVASAFSGTELVMFSIFTVWPVSSTVAGTPPLTVMKNGRIRPTMKPLKEENTGGEKVRAKEKERKDKKERPIKALKTKAKVSRLEKEKARKKEKQIRRKTKLSRNGRKKPGKKAGQKPIGSPKVGQKMNIMDMMTMITMKPIMPKNHGLKSRDRSL